MNKTRALLTIFYKVLSRDSFMVFIFFLPVFTALLFRILMPILQAGLLPYLDLYDYYPLIALFALLLSPLMSGMVAGFNLLDERDEDILTYISITPLTKNGYLLFKITAPMLLVILQSSVIMFVLNTAQLNYLRGALLIVVLCLQTPLYALIMASFASNKVEGLAVGKFAGIGILGFFASYFLNQWWKYAAALLPPFWIAESYFAENSVFWYLYASGLLYHVSLLYICISFFAKRTN